MSQFHMGQDEPWLDLPHGSVMLNCRFERNNTQLMCRFDERNAFEWDIIGEYKLYLWSTSSPEGVIFVRFTLTWPYRFVHFSRKLCYLKSEWWHAIVRWIMPSDSMCMLLASTCLHLSAPSLVPEIKTCTIVPRPKFFKRCPYYELHCDLLPFNAIMHISSPSPGFTQISLI